MRNSFPLWVPSGILSFGLALERRDIQFVSQRRLGKRDRHHAMQVVAIALKKLMRLYPQQDVEIALGATEAARIAFTLVANACAFFNTGRNVDMNRVVAMQPAPRLGRWGKDRRSPSRCRRRRCRCARSRRIPAGSGPVRGPGTAGRLRATALAVPVPLQSMQTSMTADVDLGFFAKDRLVKLDRQVEAHVRPRCTREGRLPEFRPR